MSQSVFELGKAVGTVIREFRDTFTAGFIEGLMTNSAKPNDEMDDCHTVECHHTRGAHTKGDNGISCSLCPCIQFTEKP